uniref:DNA mismatch repair protein MSH3 n=1 Tax=Gossypium raimondii TaxID=29730 RepID=A0A0D2T875_GOSRA|nr:hypothetical protein B456_008G278000 [Gossypium raimondii]
MGKQKQQVISRFFASKPKIPAASTPPPSNPSSHSSPPPKPVISSPNVKTTVSFSPSKRKLLSSHLASTPKRLKPTLSPHTQNPVPPQSNPSLHQKFLQKLLEPPSPPLLESSIEPSESDHKKYTPLEQQVVDLKNKYRDVLLMVEVGYRFRFFGKDAEIAAKVLGIYAHVDRNFLTASVPTFRLNVYVRRLVSAGYKVGVVKQTETAAIKAHGSNRVGPFGRGLSALYTKATLEAAEDVGGKEEGCGAESNYLVSVVEKVLDVSGSVSNFGGANVRIGIVGVEISTGDVVYGEFDDGVMRSGLEAVVLSLAPAELLLGQPLSKQTEKLLMAYAGPASNVRLEHASCDCFKDGGALEDVMSLYEKMVEDNLADNVNQLAEATEQRNSIQGVLNMPDLALQALALTIRHLKQFGFERILCCGASFRSLSSRVEMNLSANTLQQLEFTAVIQAILSAGKQLKRLHINEEYEDYGCNKIGVAIVQSALLRRLILTASSSKVLGNAVKLLSTLNKEAADKGDFTDLIIISKDQFPEVARARKALQLAKEKLDNLIGLYRKQFRNHKLEFTCVSGTTHLVENYVRPIFMEDNRPVQIQIHAGRHPVLETILQDNFVPNDTILHADREYCQIVTGPNMGGKSCYIRQVALIAMMAQVGSFVPAESATLPVLDAIYSRMGASDSIQQGRSTFLEELSEASQILHSCTANSLVIIDELGRGTSTHDGVAIAYATLHYLLEQKKCMVLFVTHYPKIADIKAEFPGSVEAYHVSYLTSNNDEGTIDSKSDHEITYLYKLVPGVSARSFGFKVALLAQLPSSCINKAMIMATRLETIESSRARKKSGEKQLQETPSSDQELETQAIVLKSTASFRGERTEDSEEFVSAVRDLLSKLKSATTDDDCAKSLELFKEAQGIANELINR